MKKTGLVLVTILICAAIATVVFLLTRKSDSEPGAARRDLGTAFNFVPAASKVTPAIVHIKTRYGAEPTMDPFGNLYGPPSAPSNGSGSGVCIDENGYIATNNHVVENAEQITVVFPDRRTFVAQLVGRDPDTDLALLKVSARKLPFVEIGNSDKVQVGEWVLAVGYPYSLNTTVTAGIVSAKGRSIGIINRSANNAGAGNTAIESFIQTDAAINPGNSGGALVNLDGELIGINTAIASLTGSYAGYAFAIPTNLAKKILDDLRKYGEVKRGILGVSFPSPAVEEQYLTQKGINPASVKGVFITGIQPNSAAAESGLKEGDIIQSIEGVELFSSAEFSERIARHRPGDRIRLTYLRDGKAETITVKLKGEESVPATAGDESLREIYDKLGAAFSPVPDELKERLMLNGGVLVTAVMPGGFFDQLGIPPGTVIVNINGREVFRPEDIEKTLLLARNRRVRILAIAPDGSRVAFDFSLGA